MNQLTVITDLPEWVLRLTEDFLIIVSELSGHSVLPGSIHKVDEKESDDEQNSLDGTN